MRDTGFHVPAGNLDRLPAAYRSDRETGAQALHRVDLTAEAIRLARRLCRLLPGDGEAAGLLLCLAGDPVIANTSSRRTLCEGVFAV
ncbi:hypothetical protein ABH927_001431 [Planotetraspora sp. GP83]